MRVEFARIPSSFIELHRDSINVLIDNFQEHHAVEWRCNIVPREPLRFVGQCQDIANNAVTMVQLKALAMPGNVVLVVPSDDASAKVIADWSKKHKHTTREEMDWHPFAMEAPS